MINGSIGKILVVDDEVELKNVLVEALTSQGYQAAGFTSGEEALEVLRGKAFDVLLTDLMMPGIDGITLVREGLQIDPHLVCIVMTGQGTIQTAVDAMKEGAFDYVLKPFRLQTVLPVLTRAMNTRHLRLENLQLRETVAIYELGQTIAFTLDAQTVISKLADAALQQTDADEVSVLLPTSDGSDELYVAAVRGENRKRLLGERVPLDESISGWVARERESLILDGAINDKRFRSLWPHPEIRSAISIPMQVAGKLVGTININALSRPRPFTLGQLKALTILASTAAAALESAALYAQVQRAEENYRSIFENAIDGIFRATPDAVRFISVNPFMAQMFGYESPAEMVQVVEDMTEQIGLDPASRDEALDLLEKHGVLENFETHVRRKDGSEIWVSSNIRAICDAEGNIAYLDGIVQDVTERKLAEEERKKLAAEVEKQRERLDNIVSTVPGVVWEAWGEPDTATQRINFVSDYVETMLGYSVEEWLSTPNFWLSIVHPDDKEVAARVAGESFATGKTSPQEFRWMTKDGRALWVESNYAVIKDDEGQPIGLRGVNTDISERKMAETALHESEERYRALVESLPVMIYYAQADPPYSPLYLNSNIEALGYSTDEWYAKPDLWVSLLHPDDREWVLRATEAAKSAGTKTEYEYRVVAKDGSIRWLHDRGRFFTNASGVRTWQGVILDVTERRLSEEALRESEQRYRDLVENSHEIICTHDLEGKILSLNRAALQLLGYEPSDFVDKKTIKDILAPEVRDQFDGYMKEILEKRATTNLMLVQTRCSAPSAGRAPG